MFRRVPRLALGQGFCPQIGSGGLCRLHGRPNSGESSNLFQKKQTKKEDKLLENLVDNDDQNYEILHPENFKPSLEALLNKDKNLPQMNINKIIKINKDEFKSNDLVDTKDKVEGPEKNDLELEDKEAYIRNINKLLHRKPVSDFAMENKASKFKLEPNYIKNIKNLVSAFITLNSNVLDNISTSKEDNYTYILDKEKNALNAPSPENLEQAREIYNVFKNDISEATEKERTSNTESQDTIENKNYENDLPTQKAIKAVEKCMEMYKEGLSPEQFQALALVSLTDAMHANSIVGRVQQAQLLFDMIGKFKVTPDDVAYNTLMLAYVNGNDIEGAKNVFKQMKDNGIEPDTTSYGTLISYFASINDKYATWALYEEMRQKEVFRSPVIMHSLIQLCIRNRELDRAQSLFEHVKNNMYDPTDKLYASMMFICAKRKEAEKALSLMDEMVAKNIDPSLESYLSLMMALGSRRDFYLDAFNVYEQMKELEQIPDSPRMNLVLMKICSNAADIQRFELIWKEFLNMIDEGITILPKQYYTAMVYAINCYKNYFKNMRLNSYNSQKFNSDLGTIHSSSSDVKLDGVLPEDMYVNKDAKAPSESNIDKFTEESIKKWLVLDNITPEIVSNLEKEKWDWFWNSDQIPKDIRKMDTVRKNGPLVLISKFGYLLTISSSASKYPQSHVTSFENAVKFYVENIRPFKDSVFMFMNTFLFKMFMVQSTEPGCEWPINILPSGDNADCLVQSNKQADMDTDTSVIIYNDFLKWDELQEDKTKIEVDELIGHSPMGRSGLIDEIRMRDFRDATTIRNFYIAILKALARKGDIDTMPFFMEELNNFRYPGYIAKLSSKDIPYVTKFLHHALEDGYVKETKKVIKHLVQNVEETPEERYRRLIKSKVHAPGWWGWEVINGTALKKKKTSTRNSKVHLSPSEIKEKHPAKEKDAKPPTKGWSQAQAMIDDFKNEGI